MIGIPVCFIMSVQQIIIDSPWLARMKLKEMESREALASTRQPLNSNRLDSRRLEALDALSVHLAAHCFRPHRGCKLGHLATVCISRSGAF